MSGPGVAVPIEAIVTLKRRLAVLPPRHRERWHLMMSVAELYGVSRATLYRLMRGERRSRDAHRTARGTSRVMPATEIERWCEIIAAMKARTTNRKADTCRRSVFWSFWKSTASRRRLDCNGSARSG